jgi:hypothetical protein
VTYRLKARSSEREETAVARERLGKHIPAATDTHATIEESFETVFSVLSVPVSMRSAPAMTSCINKRASGGGVFYWVRAEAL